MTATIGPRATPRARRSRRRAAVGVAMLALALVGVVSVERSGGAAAVSGAGASHDATRPTPAFRLRATGYFRTAPHNGRWWLVTPDGKPFYSSGVDHVSATPDTDQQTGRCPYCDAIAAQYPSVADWAAATVRRLHSWGFNTIGAFSDDSTFAPMMPYTELLDMASGSDWFDPAFAANADAKAASQVAPRATDPNLVGWYTDSELRWGPDWRSSLDVLDDYLALPAGSPGRTVADQYVGQPSAFLYALATRYFSVTSAAIRRYDPNHLILGAKAPSQLIEPNLLRAARPYVDVFSIDDYALVPGLEAAIHQGHPAYLVPRPGLANIEAIIGKPLMIGEYGFRAADSGLPNTWPPIFPTFATQTQRAAEYTTYVRRLYASPWMVGDAFFEFVDEPAGGRTNDGENSNWGLVTVGNVAYEAMIHAARVLHAQQPGAPGSAGG